MKIAFIVAALVVAIFVVLYLIERWQRPRRVAALLAKRPNPSFEAYAAAMPQVDDDIAIWVWNELQPYYAPELTPHPEDHITDDLAIDPDEPQFWFTQFCKEQALAWRDFPQWPKGEPVTVGRFALWLTEGRHQGRSDVVA